MVTTEFLLKLFVFCGGLTAAVGITYNMVVKKENRLTIEEMAMALARFYTSKLFMVAFAVIVIWIILKRI